MSVIENSISGASEYDTKLDKLNKEQRELVKLYYLTDEPQAKAVLQQKMNDIDSQKTWANILNFIKTFIIYIISQILLVIKHFSHLDMQIHHLLM